MKISVRGLTGEDYLSALSLRSQTQHAKRKMRAMQFVAGDGPVKCAFCDVDDVDMLTFDHKDDSGAEDRRKHGSGTAWLLKLLAGKVDVTKIQLLCANHNMKRMTESHRQRLLRSRSSDLRFSIGQIRATLNMPVKQAAVLLATTPWVVRRYRALYGLDNTPQDVG
jgi:hypothetical protein